MRADEVDVLFVNSYVAFSKKFLTYHTRLHFRGFLSTAAIDWAAEGCIWEKHCVDHRWQESYNDAKVLLMAMQEFGELRSDNHLKNLVIGGVIDDDAIAELAEKVHREDFPPPDKHLVTIVSMDGHEKVTKKLCGTQLPPKRVGRPRAERKRKHTRKVLKKPAGGNVLKKPAGSHVLKKPANNCNRKPYTCGWFMITDPRDGRVLAVEEQKTPENNAVKIAALEKIIGNYKNMDAVIHDRNCSLSPQCQRESRFPQIKYWPIDSWHGVKHKGTCVCKPFGRNRLARRIKGVNTSISEQVFSWFRHYARTINEMRQDRHVLHVLHYCKMHNGMVESGRAKHLNEFAVQAGTRKRGRVSAYAC